MFVPRVLVSKSIVASVIASKNVSKALKNSTPLSLHLRNFWRKFMAFKKLEVTQK